MYRKLCDCPTCKARRQSEVDQEFWDIVSFSFPEPEVPKSLVQRIMSYTQPEHDNHEDDYLEYMDSGLYSDSTPYEPYDDDVWWSDWEWEEMKKKRGWESYE